MAYLIIRDYFISYVVVSIKLNFYSYTPLISITSLMSLKTYVCLCLNNPPHNPHLSGFNSSYRITDAGTCEPEFGIVFIIVGSKTDCI